MILNSKLFPTVAIALTCPKSSNGICPDSETPLKLIITIIIRWSIRLRRWPRRMAKMAMKKKITTTGDDEIDDGDNENEKDVVVNDDNSDK